MLREGAVPRRIGLTKGGLSSELYAICDGDGHPLIMLSSASQVRNFKGATLMLNAPPPAEALLGDNGYGADWLRHALTALPPAPPADKPKETIPRGAALTCRRYKNEIMFGRLKD